MPGPCGRGVGRTTEYGPGRTEWSSVPGPCGREGWSHDGGVDPRNRTADYGKANVTSFRAVKRGHVFFYVCQGYRYWVVVRAPWRPQSTTTGHGVGPEGCAGRPRRSAVRSTPRDASPMTSSTREVTSTCSHREMAEDHKIRTTRRRTSLCLLRGLRCGPPPSLSCPAPVDRTGVTPAVVWCSTPGRPRRPPSRVSW